jgi:D-amino peptidase
MKALMLTDIEGVAGVVSFEPQAYPDGKYYEQAKKLLTAEVNAAVDGLLAEGVDEVIVLDGHGPGAICYEELHPAARLVHGRPVAPNWIDHEAYGEIDFCVVIGQHAMAGVADGNLNHTQNSRQIEYIKLNGKPIGELAQFAYCHGLKGRAVIFMSGDRAACREAVELIPGIVTAEVKVGLGRNCAISVSKEESYKRIREGISQAVKSFKKSRPAPLTIGGPYEIEIKYFHTDRADIAESSGGVRIDPLRVKFQSDNLRNIIYKN